MMMPLLNSNRCRWLPNKIRNRWAWDLKAVVYSLLMMRMKMEDSDSSVKRITKMLVVDINLIIILKHPKSLDSLMRKMKRMNSFPQRKHQLIHLLYPKLEVNKAHLFHLLRCQNLIFLPLLPLHLRQPLKCGMVMMMRKKKKACSL
jgi:hypothetical protein